MNTVVINPSAQDYHQLIGHIDKETREFNEGILPLMMRSTLKHKNEKHQWIVFDGLLEMQWVENLNSVLDDNKKLTLITGESLPLTPTTKVIFETTDLTFCSPATISRCGLIFIDDSHVALKSIANCYMRKFPKFLSDQVSKFERLLDYFLPDIFDRFVNQDHVHDMIYPVS